MDIIHFLPLKESGINKTSALNENGEQKGTCFIYMVVNSHWSHTFWLEKMDNTDNTDRRLSYWCPILQPYKLFIQYQFGKQYQSADFLSKYGTDKYSTAE